MTYFFKTVTFLPKNKDNETLVGRCIQILHRVCMGYSINDIGISFPNWGMSTIGDRITFISTDRKNLEFLLNQQYFFEMEKLGYFSICDTEEIIESSEKNVLFIRNQSIDNSFPGALRRDLKRGEIRTLERGEQYSPIYEGQCINIGHYHSIPVTSGSKKTDFRLNITMQELNKPINGIFTSYGLSNKTDKQCSVPLI